MVFDPKKYLAGQTNTEESAIVNFDPKKYLESNASVSEEQPITEQEIPKPIEAFNPQEYLTKQKEQPSAIETASNVIKNITTPNIIADSMTVTPKEFIGGTKYLGKSLVAGITGDLIGGALSNGVQMIADFKSQYNDIINATTPTKTALNVLMRNVMDKIPVFGQKLSDLSDVTSEDVSKKSAEYGQQLQDWTTKNFDTSDIDKGTFAQNPSLLRAAGLVTRSIPSLFAAIGSSVATGGNPLTGAAMLGLLESNYDEAKKSYKAMGYSDQDAKNRALIVGGVNSIVNTALETIPLEKFVHGMRTGGKKLDIVNKFLIGSAAEGTTETAQQMAQNITAKFAYDKNRSVFDNALESFIGGFGAGGIAAGTFAHRDNPVEAAQSILKDDYKLLEQEITANIISKGLTGKLFDPETNSTALKGIESLPMAKQSIDKGLSPEYVKELYGVQMLNIAANADVIDKALKDVINKNLQKNIDKLPIDSDLIKEQVKMYVANNNEDSKMNNIVTKQIQNIALDNEETKYVKEKIKESISKDQSEYPKEWDIQQFPTGENGVYEYKIKNSDGTENTAVYNSLNGDLYIDGKNTQNTGVKEALQEYLQNQELQENNPLVAIRDLNGVVSNIPYLPITNKTISVRDIQNNIRKIFDDIPLEQFRHERYKPSSQGYYSLKGDFIKTRRWGDLEVLAHEVAHAYQERLAKLFGTNSRKVEFYKSLFFGYPEEQITTMNKELRSLDYDQKQRRLDEGFAEFIRFYMTNEQEAKKRAPVFYSEFLNALRNNPATQKLTSDLESIKQDYDTYFAQGFLRINTAKIIMNPADRILKLRAANDVKWQQNWINSLKGIEDMVADVYGPEANSSDILKMTLKPTENPAKIAADLTYKSKSVVATMISKYQCNSQFANTGKSLNEIMKDLPPEQEQSFWTYASALREITKKGETKEKITPFLGSSKDLVVSYETANPQWRKMVEEISKWNHNIINYMYECHAISKERMEKLIAENPIYIPLQREFDEWRGSNATASIGGSGRNILNPLTSMLQLAQMKIEVAHRAKTMYALHKMYQAKSSKMSRYMIPTGSPIEAKEMQAGQLKDILRDFGYNVGDDATLDKLPIQMFIPSMRPDVVNNIYPIFDGEKMYWYQINDIGVRKGLFELDKRINNNFTKYLSPFARLVRMGATQLDAGFALFNAIRDAGTRIITTKNGIRGMNPLDSFNGIYKIAINKLGVMVSEKNIEEYLNVTRQATLVLNDKDESMALYDTALQDRLFKQGKVFLAITDSWHMKNTDPNSIIAKSINKSISTMNYTIDAIREIIGITEQAPRLMEYLESVKRYEKLREQGKINWSDEDIKMQARADADDVTVNFRRAGNKMRAISLISAFSNATVQGFDKIFRTFRDAPIQTTIRGIALMSVLKLFEFWSLQDEDWYKNLEPSYKYTNFFFTHDDHVYRIPLPYNFRDIFATLPAGIAESIKREDKYYVQQALKAILKQLNPIDVLMPSAITPFADLARNENYLGAPIESKAMEYLSPVDRVRPYTTDVSKFIVLSLDTLLNKTVDNGESPISPVQLDYALSQWTGSMSSKIINSTEWAYSLIKLATGMGDDVDIRLSDTPIIGRFVLSNPDKPTMQINRFFERLQYLRRRNQSGKLSREEKRDFEKYKVIERRYKSEVLPLMKQANKYQNDESRMRTIQERAYRIFANILKPLY